MPKQKEIKNEAGITGVSPEADRTPKRLKPTKSSVLSHLVAIAEDSDTKPKEKIAALEAIARVNGLIIKRVENTVKLGQNVMLVPCLGSIEQWESLAKISQAKLQHEAASETTPTTDSADASTPATP